MDDNVSVVVMLTVTLLIIAYIMPMGMSFISETNMTGWPTAVKTVFTVVLPMLVMIGAALYFVPHGKTKRKQ